MPFDHVNAVAAEGDSILLATAFGLRRLQPGSRGASASHLYSGAQAGGRPLTFDKVGRPATAPSRLLAEAGSACFELDSASAAPERCRKFADNLTERFVGQTNLWRWSKTDRGLTGVYLDASGAPLLPVRYRPGQRWQHDMLRSSASCDGQTAEIWASEV